MNERLENLLLPFILLTLVVVTTVDHFGDGSTVMQFLSGVLTGLCVGASVIYVWSVSSRRGKA